MAAGSQRICRKCLLKDMTEGEYFQNLYKYIANLSEDDKVSDQIYEERLAACRMCGSLQNGMCRICGCFVEMRAAMKNRHCPGIEKYW